VTMPWFHVLSFACASFTSPASADIRRACCSWCALPDIVSSRCAVYGGHVARGNERAPPSTSPPLFTLAASHVRTSVPHSLPRHHQFIIIMVIHLSSTLPTSFAMDASHFPITRFSPRFTIAAGVSHPFIICTRTTTTRCFGQWFLQYLFLKPCVSCYMIHCVNFSIKTWNEGTLLVSTNMWRIMRKTAGSRLVPTLPSIDVSTLAKPRSATSCISCKAG
jgi:hypothetical protein